MDFWRNANEVGLTIGYHKRLVIRFVYQSYQTDDRWFGFSAMWFNGRGWSNLFSVSQS